jgi:putative cardiolipin synthase
LRTWPAIARTLFIFLLLHFSVISATADTVNLLSTPMSAATARVEMILGAREEISAEYFIVGDDPFSLTSLALLREAARRGVTVRLIIDAQWNKVPKAVMSHLIAEGVEVRIYHPFRPGRPDWLTRRLHDKLLVVDGREMITGGRNIESPYFGLGRQVGRRNYIDCDIRIQGATAAGARDYFNALWNSREVRHSKARRYDRGLEMAEALLDAYKDWLDQQVAEVLEVGGPWDPLHSPNPSPVKVKENAIRFLHDPVGQKGRAPGVGEELLALMDAAEESLLIESPYLVPSKAFKEGLKRARDRGVRVRILTNSLAATDNIFPQAGYAWYKKPLVRMGIELWEYVGSDCLHTKAAVIDGRQLIVGTYNLDPRSEQLNSEMAVVVENRELAEQMLKIMDQGLEDAVRIGPNGKPEGSPLRHPGASAWKRFKLFLLKPVAPFIKRQL